MMIFLEIGKSTSHFLVGDDYLSAYLSQV